VNIRLIIGFFAGIVISFLVADSNIVAGLVCGLGGFLLIVLWPFIHRHQHEIFLTIILFMLMGIIIGMKRPVIISPFWGLLFFPIFYAAPEWLPLLGLIPGVRRGYGIVLILCNNSNELLLKWIKWGVTLLGSLVPPYGLYMQSQWRAMYGMTFVSAVIVLTAPPESLPEALKGLYWGSVLAQLVYFVYRDETNKVLARIITGFFGISIFVVLAFQYPQIAGSVLLWALKSIWWLVSGLLGLAFNLALVVLVGWLIWRFGISRFVKRRK